MIIKACDFVKRIAKMKRFLLISVYFLQVLANLDNATKPVKLTMKQGLMMNQILSTYALDNAKEPLCKNHTIRFKNGLRAFEPWALKMFDSSSKIQSGVLLGNLVEFGSFRQCIQVKFGDISGKHCLIKITPTLDLIKKILSFRNVSSGRFKKVRLIVEKAALYWSVCVPASCPRDDILEHFQKIILEMSEGLNFTVTVDEKHCLTAENDFKIGLGQYFALTFLIGVFLMSLISTLIYCTSDRRNAFVRAFSIHVNYQKIVFKQHKHNLDFLHGLRYLSTCYVVIGHRFLMAMFFPVINSLETLDWTLNYSSTIIIGGTICVDTFFMISGMLVSIGFFEYVTKNNSFNLAKFYILRYFRITLALGVVVLIYSTLIEFWGTGPLWYDTCQAHLVPCKYYWWSTILHIQSYINPGALCILQTWYLTCDMIFYYFSPVILYPLWKCKIFGFINYLALYILSVGTSFYLAWINEYEGGMPITNQLFETKYFQEHYITPHTRAAPYIIGLGLGYYIFQLNGRKIEMGPITNVIGWLVATLLMISSVVGCHVFQLEDHDYNRLEASIFLSCSRSAWTFGLVWMVFACFTGHGGIVNDFLSLFVFRVLGRISYGVFLLHLIVQIFKNGANKMPIYFSNFTAIYDSLADLFLINLVSFAFTIFYELPLTQLTTLLFKKKTILLSLYLTCFVRLNKIFILLSDLIFTYFSQSIEIHNPDKMARTRRTRRKMVIDFIKMFFTQSSIHGLPHMTAPRRHPVEIVIWISVVAAAVYGAVVLSSMTLRRYIENPTVITMERDRFSWNTTFPAATICPSYKINEDMLDEFVSKSTEKNKTLLRDFLITLASATYTNFEQVVPYDGITEEQYLDILMDIQFEFKPAVSNSGNSNKNYTLQRIVSEMGICYSFNSKLAVYSSPEYWDEGRWDLVEGDETFYVNPLDGEVFANVMNMATGFDIYIHGSYEVADIASKKISSPDGYFLQMYLSGLTIFSSDNIKNLRIKQRKCRFHDESDLSHFPAYSYVLCRMECRAKLARRLCGCVPHFYRKLDGVKICNVPGLHCLAKHKERLILLKGECSCLPNCNEVNYIVEDVDTKEWFLGSNLQWGLKDYPKMRLRRDIIFGFSDLLVYIGGMAGLFLGCSVLSFMEIIYFFTLRLYWFVVKYGKETRERF